MQSIDDNFTERSYICLNYRYIRLNFIYTQALCNINAANGAPFTPLATRSASR